MPKRLIRGYGSTKSKIMVVIDSPTMEDYNRNSPLAGSQGTILFAMLKDAGIGKFDCYFTYAHKCPLIARDWERAYTKKSTMTPTADYAASLELLEQEIEMVKPDLIITMGELPLQALSGESRLGRWRGSTILSKYGIKMICTYDPVVIMKKMEWRYVTVRDLKRVNVELQSRQLRDPRYVFETKPTFEKALERIEWLISQCDNSYAEGKRYHVASDIETIARNISCIGFAWSKREAICIPLMDGGRIAGYYTEDEETRLVLAMRRLLSHKGVFITGQNFVYDEQYIKRFWGVDANVGGDTMVAFHTLFPGEKKSLDMLSSLFCDIHVYWKDELKDYNTYPENPEQYWTYNCKDCVITYEVWEALQPLISSAGLQKQLDHQMAVRVQALQMMYRGANFDPVRRAEIQLELMEQQAQVAFRLEKVQAVYLAWKLEGVTKPADIKRINKHGKFYESPHQCTQFLYDYLQLPKQYNKKTKRVTSDDNAITALIKKEPLIAPVLKLLQGYRSLGVFKSTFADVAIDTDLRWRSALNVSGTETFRFSSSGDAFGFGTNMQNIPKGN